MKKFSKKVKKVLQKFGGFKNLPYLCTTFDNEIVTKVLKTVL